MNSVKASLIFLCLVCTILFFTLPVLGEDRRTNSIPFPFVKKDPADISLDEDIIEIALGDGRREVWQEVRMTPDLKANKMSSHRKIKREKRAVEGKRNQKARRDEALRKETPFDKYLPFKNAKA